MATKVNNQVNESANEVMDARIVKLNELKSVKMANLSKGKRPAAKEAKELATYILNNWDDEFELLKIKSEDVKNEDLQSILSSRLNNFVEAKKACEEAVKETPKKEKKAKTQPKYESTPKAEEKKPTEKKEATKPATSTRKVGDIHKNGKWVWTEYAPGKFDWRTIPSMKQKTGAKPKVETEGKKAEKKQTATKSNKAEKSTAKQTKKGEPKKNSPEAPKVLTIDEFVALPVKTAKTNKKPSPAQAEALKLINKGYRITADQKFFEKDGDRKSCNMDSVTAMFKRYSIDYIPEGLIIK